MPKASAPKAPWVEVWLSPQTIVIPGWVTPSSGPITWTMPWRSDPRLYSFRPNSSQLRSRVSTWTRGSPPGVGQLQAELLAVALQGFDLDAGELVGDQPGRHRAVGRRVVVRRGQRFVGAAHGATGQAEAVEGLRRGHLMDQVQVDVDQPLADLMLLPDLFEHVS